MRAAHILALALLLTASSGCWIFDEIDEGRKQWEHHSPKKKPAPLEEEPAPAPTDEGAQRDAWWRGARSIGSEELSADIVGCALGGRRQFMREADCLSQGGTPR